MARVRMNLRSNMVLGPVLLASVALVVSGGSGARLLEHSKGERVSLLRPQPPSQGPLVQVTTTNPKKCVTRQILAASAGARYCERCGKALKVGCQKCNGSIDAVYDCTDCGNPISLTA